VGFRKVFLLLGLFCASVALFIPTGAWAGPKGTIALSSAVLTRELNLVLKAGDSVHHSLFAQNEELTDIGLRDLLKQIASARAHLGFAKDYERPHLVRILDAAQEQFELSQVAYGQERRARLAEGFNQLVNLVRIYKLDKQYGIYFCPSDRSTWVQTGTKAQYPFSQAGSREPCGLKVER
jgi:hypothetical protein